PVGGAGQGHGLPDHIAPSGAPHRGLCMPVGQLRVLLDEQASHHQVTADPLSALLAQRAQPLPGFTVQLGERHALVDRRVEWPVCLRRAGITTGQRAPMLPLPRRAATIRPPWVSTTIATTSAPCPRRVPAAARTPRAVTAGPPVPTALTLALRPATAATICFTPRPARAVAAAPSARVVRRGGRLLGVSFVAVLSLAGHHNPSPLFKYVPSLPADA